MNNASKPTKAISLKSVILILFTTATVIAGFFISFQIVRSHFPQVITIEKPVASKSEIDRETRLEPPLLGMPNSIYVASASDLGSKEETFSNALFFIGKDGGESGIIKTERAGADANFSELEFYEFVTSFDQSQTILPENLYYSEENKLVYVAFVEERDDTGKASIVIKVNLESGTKELVWERSLEKHQFSDAQYQSSRGAAFVLDAASDETIVLGIRNCFGCDGSPYDAPGILVINLKSGAQKYIGEVGYTALNTVNQTLEGNAYELVEESCQIGPHCSQGAWMIKRPVGKKLVFDLP